jgi:hypothetical protein
MKKILYVILHGSINKERYYNIKETWGSNVDTLFYSDYEELDKNIIKVSNRNDYHSNEEKHINVLKFVNDNIKDYEWFFFCDDDTFVNTKKLETNLEIFNKNSVNGSVINCWPSDWNLNYCSGGAGYLIHHELLNTITKNIKILNTGYSDVTLGLHLKDLNIEVIDYNLFRSQSPTSFNYSDYEIKNFISFHYIKTKEEMNSLLDKI